METGKWEIKKLFAGERLSLDFINTACRRRDEELEFLGTAQELQQWLRQAEGVHNTQLYVGGEWDAEQGEKLLSKAVSLRSALREVVLAIIERRPALPGAIETVNSILRTNPIYPQMNLTAEGLTESIKAKNLNEVWLTVIARDAVDLVCHSELSLLRRCEHPTCVRVFYDTTKNHRRRWCVEKCGTHSKAAAYYRRKVAKSRLRSEHEETDKS